MHEALRSLQKIFTTEIPITRYLSVSVASYQNGCLTLLAPLQENSNHVHTAFAGSLNAVMTLAGWGQLWLILKEYELEGQIVIQNSVIEYLKPVTDGFTVHCQRPDAAIVERLLKTLGRKGKARQELVAEIYEKGQRAVSFVGRYVVTVSTPRPNRLTPDPVAAE